MSSNQKFCPTCGAYLPQGSHFCPLCGFELSRPQPQIVQSISVQNRSHPRRNVALLVIAILVIGVAVGAIALFPDTHPSESYPIYNGYFGYYLKNSSIPAPVGLAAFGLKNTSGVIRPYTVDTNEVTANAQIQNVSALSPSLSSSEPYGASLILVAILEVNRTSSLPSQVFWLGNTLGFDTDTQGVFPSDSVLNLTMRNSSLVAYGPGKVTNGSYFHQINYRFYSLPFNVSLAISVGIVAGGVEIQFYNSPFGNMNASTSSSRFDGVTLPISNVRSAGIVVTPYRQILNALPFDVEIDWGGFCCGDSTAFTQMKSNLSLSYINSQGEETYFPYYFSFGAENGVTATNLVVSLTAHGATVSLESRENNSFAGPT